MVPAPTYAMYRVCTEQRGATVVSVPAPWARPTAGRSTSPPSGRRPLTPSLVWLCSPNNPTALAEPDGAIAGLLDGLADDARSAGREAPIVVLDEAYAEFVGSSLRGAPRRLPQPDRGPHDQQGLRPGRAAGRLRRRPTRGHRPDQPVPAARVGVGDLGHDRHRGPPRRHDPGRQPGPGRATSDRACRTASAQAGWAVGPSVTNFVLVDFGTPERAADVAEALLTRGLVPRTFAAGHPLAGHLRLTVRDPDENDRLIAVAQALAKETPR